MIPGSREIAAPPVSVAIDSSDSLHDDEPIRIDTKDGITGALGRHPPVGTRVPITPGRGSMRLVMQVSRDDRRLGTVPARQHRPVVDPAGLRDAICIPEFALGISTGPMSIEDDRQTSAPSALDDPVHHLQTGQAVQIWI